MLRCLLGLLIVISCANSTYGQAESEFRQYNDSVRQSIFNRIPTIYNIVDESALKQFNSKLVLAVRWNPLSLTDCQTASAMKAIADKESDLAFLLVIPNDIKDIVDSTFVAQHVRGMGWHDVVVAMQGSVQGYGDNTLSEPYSAILIKPGGGYFPYTDANFENAFRENLQFLQANSLLTAPVKKSTFPQSAFVHPMYPVLSGPEGILATDDGLLLFIADSGNNRILICDQDGEVREVIGSGKADYLDGRFEKASFRHPVGLAYDKGRNILYISDSFNHCVRAANLNTNIVQTILGNGSRSVQVSNLIDGVSGRLDTPWDIEISGNDLLIANAGKGQLLRMNRDSYKAQVVLGSGNRKDQDGKAKKAGFKSLRSFAADGSNYYILDTEVGKLKALKGKKVKTLNKGKWADKSERTVLINNAPLHHPSGLTYIKGDLWMCDALSHQIKLMPSNNMLTTLIGSGEKGNIDGSLEEAEFNMPVDLSEGGQNKIFICDRLNNSIRVFNQKNGQVSTLNIYGGSSRLRPTPVLQPQQSTSQIVLLEDWPEDGILEIHFQADGLKPLDFPKSTAALTTSRSGEVDMSLLSEGIVLLNVDKRYAMAGVNLIVDLVLHDGKKGNFHFAHPEIFIMPIEADIKPNAVGPIITYDLTKGMVVR